MAFDEDGQAVIPISIDPGLAGTTRYYQVTFRDPGASFDLGLTNGLHVDFCD